MAHGTRLPQSTGCVASGRSLYRVNQIIRDEQMSQLKLFTIIMDAPISTTSKASGVCDIMDVLEGKFTRKKAAALLQSMLTVIEVKTDTVALLGSAQEDLEACKKLDKFTFGKLLITVCQELDKEKFKKLKVLLRDVLKESPEKIQTPEQLLLILIQANELTETNLHLLTSNLDELGLNRSAGMLEEFRQKNKSFTQETEHGQEQSSLESGVSPFAYSKGLVLPRGDNPPADQSEKDSTSGKGTMPCSNATHENSCNLMMQHPDTDDEGPPYSDSNQTKEESLQALDEIQTHQTQSDNDRNHTGTVPSTYVGSGLNTDTMCVPQIPTQTGNTDQSALPESDGSKRTSYPPYPRKLKGKMDRSMDHTPKLKLDAETDKETPMYTWPVQLPSSLPGLYPMKSKEHGVALVINNKTFTHHKVRNGTDRDEENLVETFRYLGYRVEIRRDCTKEDMEDLFDKIDDSLIKDEDDSFVCCILSHGSDNTVYGSDSKEVCLRTSENSLEKKLADKCSRLKGKPKMFFISTCRNMKRPPTGTSTGTQTAPESDGDDHPRGDFVFNFATLPGEGSLRYPDTGTIYIHRLCDVLCKFATKATLADMQKQVIKELNDNREEQVPASEEQLEQNVYFFNDFY